MDDQTKDFLNEMVQGQVRHGLTIIGAALVSHGALAASDEAQFVQIGTGIAIALLGMGWSALHKWWMTRQPPPADLAAIKGGKG